MRRWITLLVLVLVLVVAGGLLIPAVARVRDTANRLQGARNLQQIGLAIANYYDANGRFPGGPP